MTGTGTVVVARYLLVFELFSVFDPDEAPVTLADWAGVTRGLVSA